MNLRRIPLLVAAVGIAIGFGSITSAAGGTATAVTPWHAPPVRHVFVVNLENESEAVTFGATSPATYLNHTLLPKGQLLDNYYGVAYNSLPNYIAQISGQGPNPQTQGDCQVFTDFRQIATVNPGQAVGSGCVFPAGVRDARDRPFATPPGPPEGVDDAQPFVHHTRPVRRRTRRAVR